MKNLLYRLFIIGLFIFSFYYTNQVVNYLKEKDPIMQKIKDTSPKYKLEPTNAQIIGNYIISGQKGKEIDYEKTYNNMKSYGTYNESLTVLKETDPLISIDNTYDKYVIRGNKRNKQIALLFLIKENKDPAGILSILEKKKVVGTFFLDGSYLENNIKMIKQNKNHEFELLSYQQEYNESFFKTSLSYLENITKNKTKYCYTEKENQKLLEMCKKLKLHTVKPTIVIKNNSYKRVKENLANGTILSLEINQELERKLSNIIDYTKEKGYQIVSLEKLLSE